MKTDKNLFNSNSYNSSNLESQFGKSIARSLDASLEQVSPKVSARLEQSRKLALSKKKPQKALVQINQLSFAGKNSTTTQFSSLGKIWGNVAWLAPLLVLTIGLLAISQWQQDARINDIADVDTALLSDEVPPDAYADNGFWAFLKNIQNQNNDSSSNSNSSQIDK